MQTLEEARRGEASAPVRRRRGPLGPARGGRSPQNMLSLMLEVDRCRWKRGVRSWMLESECRVGRKLGAEVGQVRWKINR